MATVAIVSNTAWSLINFRKELIDFLQKKGHRVLTVAPADKYVEQLRKMSDGFFPLNHLAAQGRNPARDLRLSKELRQLYKQESIDVAFTFTAKPNIYGNLAAIGTSTKVIPTVNGLGNAFIVPSKTQTIMRTLYRFAFMRSEKVIFQNPDDRDLFLQKKIVSRKQVLLSPGSGVNLEAFKAKEKSRRDSIVFLFSARLVSEKGIFEYLEAARELHRKNIAAEFHVLGTPGNNPSSIKLRDLEDYVQKGEVSYLGHTDDMNQELEKVDVLVLPSYYREGIPRVLLEGLAKGLPLITTDSTGCRETVIDGVNGIMIPPRDKDALVKAMEKLARMSPNDREEMGRQSNLLAGEKFDVQKVVAIYDGLLN